MGAYTKYVKELILSLEDHIITSKDFNPDISIILLTHNNEKTIEQCLSNLLRQTYKNFEIIILDDSEDFTSDVIHILTIDSRIKHFKCKKNEMMFDLKEAVKHINTNKVLVIKPSHILGKEDIEFLFQNNKIKDLPYINYYPKWKMLFIRVKRFFKDFKE